ncbi:MAG: dihydrofolate reductase [Thermoanaerobaculia bacterium]
MKLTIIAAIGRNGEIGRGGGMPWRLPSDLAFFKRTTMGHAVIMGRKTFDEVKKPLPGRENIVVTRNRRFAADGVIAVGSFDEAIAHCAGREEAFVIGGAEIYRQALGIADRMILTRIDGEFEADTHFPAFDERAWREVSRETHEPDEKNKWGFAFVVMERGR